MLGGDAEVVGLFGGPGIMFFGYKVEVLDDEVVLGDVFNILIGEDDVLLLVDLKLDVQKLLVFGLYLLLG